MCDFQHWVEEFWFYVIYKNEIEYKLQIYFWVKKTQLKKMHCIRMIYYAYIPRILQILVDMRAKWMPLFNQIVIVAPDKDYIGQYIGCSRG